MAAAAAAQAALGRYEEQAGKVVRLQGELTESVTALERSRVEVRCLQQDLEVKEAYLSSLRGLEAHRQSEAQKLSETARALEARLLQVEAQAAAELLARDQNVRILQERLSRIEAQALGSARAAAEMRDEVRGYQATLGLPRYRVADVLNRAFRATGPIHRLVKSFVKRRVNGE